MILASDLVRHSTKRYDPLAWTRRAFFCATMECRTLRVPLQHGPYTLKSIREINPPRSAGLTFNWRIASW